MDYRTTLKIMIQFDAMDQDRAEARANADAAFIRALLQGVGSRVIRSHASSPSLLDGMFVTTLKVFVGLDATDRDEALELARDEALHAKLLLEEQGRYVVATWFGSVLDNSRKRIYPGEWCNF